MNTNLVPATLRSFKSAVLHVLYTIGEAMSEADSVRLDRILDGFECAKAQPPRIRAAPTEEQVLATADRAVEEKKVLEGLAIIVGFGLACRSRELVGMEACHIDFERGFILVERKAPQLSKVRQFYCEKPITCERSLRILRELAERQENCSRA
jgi:integrase